MKNHSLNQIAVFQNVIKNHMIVMKSEYYRPACASCTMQQARAESICADVHTARAKAKYAHNHVTAESAQPRNRSKCARPSPVLWVGSGHETTYIAAYDEMYESDSHPSLFTAALLE